MVMNMKKNKVPVLAGFFIAGLLLVFVTNSLAGKNPLFYIGTAAATILSVVSVVIIVKLLADGSNKKFDKSNELLDVLMKKNEELENKLAESVSTQSEMRELFSDFCKEADSYMQQLDKTEKTIASENAEHVDKLSRMFDEALNKLGKSINDKTSVISEILISLIDCSKKELSVMREDTSASLAELTKQTAESVSEQIKISYESLSNMQNAFDTTSKVGMDKIQGLITDFSNVTDMKLETTNVQYQEMLDALRKEMSDRFERLSSCIDDSIKKYTERISSHNNELSDKIADITEKHTSNLASQNNEAIAEASEQLAQSNREMLKEQTEQFSSRMNQVAQRYDHIMQDHTEMLSKKTEDSIKQFIESSDMVFVKNAAVTEELLKTEKSFLDEYSLHNIDMKKLLKDCFIRYSEAVAELVAQLERKVSECISNEEDAYAKQLGDLRSALQEYSDSFVDRSADAVAKEMEILQQDNNVKLKQMCDSIGQLADTASGFAEECRANDRRTTESIGSVIEQNKSFIDNMRAVNIDSIIEVKGVLDNHLNSYVTEMSILNAENSRAFSDSMAEYREQFIEASAQANVQKDNISAISSAHNKLVELAAMIQDTQTQYSKLTASIMTVLSETKNAINQGNETAQKHYENQDECLEERINDLASIFKKKLSEYNDKVEETLNIITTLEQTVQHNTQSYQDTLKQITDSQNAMNALTTRDIDVLERLVGK